MRALLWSEFFIPAIYDSAALLISVLHLELKSKVQLLLVYADLQDVSPVGFVFHL